MRRRLPRSKRHPFIEGASSLIDSSSVGHRCELNDQSNRADKVSEVPANRTRG